MELISSEKIKAKIRYMYNRDLVLIQEIEDYTESGWKMSDFKDFQKKENNIILISEFGGQAVGFLACELNEKNVYIVNMSVSPFMRRRSIGTQLIDRIKNGFMKSDRSVCQIVITDRNLDAHLFFRKNSFIATQIFKEFFTRKNDGYLFEYFK